MKRRSAKLTEGRTRVNNIFSSPVNLPDTLKNTPINTIIKYSTIEGRTTTHNSRPPLITTIRPYYTVMAMSKNEHFHKMGTFIN